MTTDGAIKVMIVDDHAVVRAGLRMLIESRSGLTVVGEAPDADSALRLVGSAAPDVVLLDLDLGGHSGLDILPQLRSATGSTKVLLLTGARDPELHYRAVRLGAQGVILKDQAADMLVKAIQQVHAGQIWLDAALTARVVADLSRQGREKEDPEAARVASLTEREREVVSLICEGLQNKQIAQRMTITETTVRHHLTSIFSKLGITNRLELVIYAYKHGLSTPPK